MTPIERKHPRVWTVAVVVGAAFLAGCVVVPAGGRHGGSYGGGPGGGYGSPGPDVVDGGVVAVAPPAPQVEVIPVAPGPGFFWISGYWTWHLGRHLWVGGRWAPSRPGWGWTPHRWEPYGRGWRQAPGRWSRR